MGQAQPRMTDEQILKDMQAHYSNLGDGKKDLETKKNTVDKETSNTTNTSMNKAELKEIPTLSQSQPQPQVKKQYTPANINPRSEIQTQSLSKPQPAPILQKETQQEQLTQSIPQIEAEPEAEAKAKKKINLEHVTIEKIFQITLSDTDLNPSLSKNVYLELYQAQLLSQNKVIEFSIDNLDEILLTIINDSQYKTDIISYLLKCYSRAYQIIEVRYKNQLNENFLTILSTIATILGEIISSSSNFGLEISKVQIKDTLTEYYTNPELDLEELLSLLTNIVINGISDKETLSNIFFYIFNILHLDNNATFPHCQSFFSCDKIRKNVNVLVQLFTKNKILRRLYTKEPNFNSCPQNINGKLYQSITFISPLLNMSPLDADPKTLRNSIKTQLTDNSGQTKAYASKLTKMHLSFAELLQLLLDDCDSSQALLDYFINVIILNIDKTKMMSNPFITATTGFLMNCSIACLNLFFNECQKKHGNEEGVAYYFLISQLIDIDYCISDCKLPFNKFNSINSLEAKEYTAIASTQANSKKYETITQLFFITHCIISYYMKNLDENYTQIIKSLNEMSIAQGFDSPIFKDSFAMMTAYDIYMKNSDFIKMLMSFNEITYLLIFSLNNSKYSHYSNPDTNQIDSSVDFNLFYTDFHKNITLSSICHLSILPEILITNVILTSIFLRKYSSELYFKDSHQVKSLILFSILYSSNLDLIQNPHLRSEIFDILTYTFLVNEKEKGLNNIQSINSKILQDPFVEDNLIKCLMRVFIDAERLGTSNQFYEKFSIRSKVLTLIENIFKRHNQIFKEGIVSYAEHNDVSKMLILLMNDVTYLIDESIQKLPEIKAYEDLLQDNEAYNKLDDEIKKDEEKKFEENKRIITSELALLNSSLGFMVIICSCLQKYFMNNRQLERLANFLNYVLDEFTTKTSKMKIKNKGQYNFNPSLIFSSLIKMYVSFSDYDEFHDYVVSDKRSYKYDNFLTAIYIRNTKKSISVLISCEIAETFEEMVNVKWKNAEERVKQKEINYADAPEEFIDPITSEIMEDPVLLPGSKMIVDRIAIETHLINDNTDPFNRMMLTKEMLVSDTELKERIRKYKEDKKKEKIIDKIEP